MRELQQHANRVARKQISRALKLYVVESEAGRHSAGFRKWSEETKAKRRAWQSIKHAEERMTSRCEHDHSLLSWKSNKCTLTHRHESNLRENTHTKYKNKHSSNNNYTCCVFTKYRWKWRPWNWLKKSLTHNFTHLQNQSFLRLPAMHEAQKSNVFEAVYGDLL